MVPNLISAESVAHRARFVWLGAALAATIALVVVLATPAPPPARAPKPSQLERIGGCAEHPGLRDRRAIEQQRELERRERREQRELERRVRREMRDAPRVAPGSP